MDSLEKFHARLKQLIAEDGTKLRPLAKKLGVSSIGILSDWQNGNKTPRADSVLKLADYFGVTTDYLLGLTDIRTTSTSVRAAAELTGLSESAVNILSQMERPAVEKISKLIEFYNTIR